MNSFRWILGIAASLCFLVAVLAAPASEDRAAKTMAAWAAPTPGKVFVVSHRADWRNFPENSLAAIRSSIAMGVDMIEVDLQRTKDGELVLMHDPTVERTTIGTGRVEELALSEIRALKLRDGLGQPTAFTVPTLREALAVSGDRIAVNLDKSFRHLDLVLPVLDEVGARRHVLLKGSGSVAEVKARHGELWTRYAYMPVVNLDHPGALDSVRDWLENARPAAVELVFSRWTPEVDEAFAFCRAAGVRIWVNTLWPHLSGGRNDDAALDEPERVYGWFIEKGVTVFQTDRPRELLSYLARRAPLTGK